MLRRRVIPVLLVQEGGLVKPRGFRKPSYLGDPINAVRIFNDKEVPELVVLDIGARRQGRGPDLTLVRELATECFVPLCYGGGVSTIEEIGKILEIGVEKVSMNSILFERPRVLTEAAKRFGSQSLVVSIDVRWSWLRGCSAYSLCGTRRQSVGPVEHARRMEEAGAGEILLTAIEREGAMQGYDLELIRSVSEAVDIPVIANGGAGAVEHFRLVVEEAGADAVAAGSFFVFEGPHRAVLISYPDERDLQDALEPGSR